MPVNDSVFFFDKKYFKVSAIVFVECGSFNLDKKLSIRLVDGTTLDGKISPLNMETISAILRAYGFSADETKVLDGLVKQAAKSRGAKLANEDERARKQVKAPRNEPASPKKR